MRKIVFERSDGLSSFGCVNPVGCCYEWIWRMVSLLTSRQNHLYQQEANSLSHPKEVFSVFVNQLLKPHSNHLEPFKPLEPHSNISPPPSSNKDYESNADGRVRKSLRHIVVIPWSSWCTSWSSATMTTFLKESSTFERDRHSCLLFSSVSILYADCI